VEHRRRLGRSVAERGDDARERRRRQLDAAELKTIAQALASVGERSPESLAARSET
jgi:hypothetical protein